MAEIHESVELGNTNSGRCETSSSSSSVYHSTRIVGLLRSRTEYETAVDFEIDASKDHWSELLQPSSAVEATLGGETHNAARTSREIVESLRRQFPLTGGFFAEHDSLMLPLGRKIAEGGQAEIFDTGSAKTNMVFKVFKGSSVLELQNQWPAVLLNLQTESGRKLVHTRYVNCSKMRHGIVLEDGRFAFYMMKCAGDLRKLIDMRMLRNRNAPPFSAEELEENMLGIAFGMKFLHEDGIVHRDLKAANILLQSFTNFEADLDSMCSGLNEYVCVVADFECSVGVVGTRFWRAPEILQGLKACNITPDLFTKGADVYRYGMVCYEMITGRLPFEGVRLNDYDVVLQGNQPTLPEETSPWIKALLSRCWHLDPNERPDFEEIVRCIRVHKMGQ